MKNIQTIILAVIGVAIVVFLSLVVGRGASTQTPSAPSDTAASSTSAARTDKPTETVDLASIGDLEASIAYLDQVADNGRFYTVDWTHIVEVSLEGQKMYFGMMERKAGNGVEDANMIPLFLVNGTLYTPWGFGGDVYPLNETGWMTRYRYMNIDGFTPVELSGNVDQEVVDTWKIKSGIDGIYLTQDKDGTITHLEVTIGGRKYAFDPPFTRVKDVNLVTRPALAGALDYDAYMEQFRVLPGNASGSAVYPVDTGYQVTYPATLNGLRVIPVQEGRHSYSFSTADDPSDPTRASMWCTPNPELQVGPQVNGELIISPQSMAKLIDWGYRKDIQAETISFTGPGFYCTLSTSGAFRPYMFSVAF